MIGEILRFLQVFFLIALALYLAIGVIIVYSY